MNYEIKHICIKKNPNFIILTKHEDKFYCYYVADLRTFNKYCDYGIWRIKYRSEQS
jgi:hypothetical protein